MKEHFYLGVDDRGEIAVGRLADMVAVDGNPLEDISVMEAVSFVMKGGEVYKNNQFAISAIVGLLDAESPRTSSGNLQFD